MIDSAPLFLGFFALIGGVSKEKSVFLIAKLQNASSFLSQETERLKDQTSSTLHQYKASIAKLNKEFLAIDHFNSSTQEEIKTVIGGSTKFDSEVREMKDALNQLSSYNKLVSATNSRVKQFLDNYFQDIQKLQEYFDYLNSFSREIEMLAVNSSIEANRYGKEGKAFMVFAQNIHILANETRTRNKQVLGLIKRISDESDSLKEAINGDRENINAVLSMVEGFDDNTEQFSDGIKSIVESLQRAIENLSKQNSLTAGFGSSLENIGTSNDEIMEQLESAVSKQVAIIHQINSLSNRQKMNGSVAK